MLSKNQIRQLRNLQRKKARHELGLFLVEGGKPVAELLASDWPVRDVFVTDDYAERHAALLQQTSARVTRCTAEQLTAAGSLGSNREAIAVAAIRQDQVPLQHRPGQWILALDRINDPGNLGTLLRIADWYGICQLVCSPDTVELYNPKVISASMGSFLRVNVQYRSLELWLDSLPAEVPVLGAYLDGESVHGLPAMPAGGVLLMGSEAHGLAPELSGHVTRRITIPCFGQAESLNVAMATAILCDNLARINDFSAQ